MVSPLQVAILLALVDQRGDAPTDRWSLFEKFYAVVLEREQGKVGPVGETMRHWGRQITALHHRAGFLLHVEAEKRGKSDAFLTQEELRVLIRGQLTDEEPEGMELSTISEELLAASTSRLVLLVQREEGKYEFEVRSLQEFMAAAYLMIGKERIVQERLQFIAYCNHWLHVFQIAASKCFAVADAEHLRDTIITICQTQNEAGENLDQVLRTGSRLALALLDDGLAYDQPRYRRLLFRISLDLLYNGSGRLQSSLTKHCLIEPSRTMEGLRTFIDSTRMPLRNAARSLLLRCAAQNADWAMKELTTIWPDDPVECAHIMALPDLIHVGTPAEPLLRSALERMCLITFVTLPREDDGPYNHHQYSSQHFPCLNLLQGDNEKIAVVQASVTFNEITPLAFVFTSMELSSKQNAHLLDMPMTLNWAPIRQLYHFQAQPTANTLVNFLEQASSDGSLELCDKLISTIIWPLATCLWLLRYGVAIDTVVSDLRNGKFGDTEEWRSAERRWADKGITEADLNIWRTGIFFDSSVASVGAPWALLRITHERTPQPWVDRLFDIANTTTGILRVHLRHILSFVVGVYPKDSNLDISRARILLEIPIPNTRQERISVDLLQAFTPELFDDSSTLEAIDRWGTLQSVYLNVSRDAWAPKVFDYLLCHYRDYPGLVVFMGSLISTKGHSFDFAKFRNEDLRLAQRNDNSTIAGYAHIIETLISGPSSNNTEAILSTVPRSLFPLALLKHVLDGDRIDVSNKVHLANLIASLLLHLDDSTRLSIFNELRRESDQRLAQLRDANCWRRLELGGTLLAQAEMRTGSLR